MVYNLFQSTTDLPTFYKLIKPIYFYLTSFFFDQDICKYLLEDNFILISAIRSLKVTSETKCVANFEWLKLLCQILSSENDDYVDVFVENQGLDVLMSLINKPTFDNPERIALA